jgi:hypothetical protein
MREFNFRKYESICFVVRDDFVKFRGGDIDLVHSYAAELSTFKSVSVITYSELNQLDIDSVDLVFFINLDRPKPIVDAINKYDYKNCETALYTLFHPPAGIFLKKFSLRFNFLAAWLVKLKIHFFFRRNFNRSFKQGLYVLEDYILKSINHIICVNNDELSEIKKYFKIDNDHVNFLRHKVFQHEGEKRIVNNRICVPGRIEKRKNQLLVFKIVDHFPDIDFYFIGSGDKDSTYYKKFLFSLSKKRNCFHFDHMAKIDFYNFLLSSKVVLNNSFFEVQSTIDLFCIENGISLVTTKYCYLNRDANKKVWMIFPGSINQTLITLRSVLDV